jgi:hypothetical protein
MGVRNLGESALEGLVAFEAEFRHLLHQKGLVGGAVRVVTGGAGRDYYGRMAKGGILDGDGKVLMTGEAPLVHRTGKELLSGGPVRIVACGAGAGGDGTVNEFPIEGGLVMAVEAESSEVFAVVQEVTAVGAVGLVAGDAVAVLDR